MEVTKKKFKQHMCHGEASHVQNQHMEVAAECDFQFSLTRVIEDPEDIDDPGYWEKLWLNLAKDTISKNSTFLG